jgi:hypothetical protein
MVFWERRLRPGRPAGGTEDEIADAIWHLRYCLQAAEAQGEQFKPNAVKARRMLRAENQE